MKAIGIKCARIYASASDLFFLNNYPKGWDPEMGVSEYPITYPSQGKIETISGVIDTSTGTVSLRAVFPNKEGLLQSGGGLLYTSSLITQ